MEWLQPENARRWTRDADSIYERLDVELAAILAAVASAGAGHGHYVAARALFPAPMLLGFLEGDRIGPFSLASGLLQFPVYGALLLLSVAHRNYRPAIAVAWLHLLAMIICFSGALSDFS